MSGICGIVRLDGAPTRREEMGPILDAIQRRGPDRTGRWSDGSAALGHALLATTPDAATEAMPLRHGESGCVITADARLDNRDELIPALAPGGEGIGDGELILRAYLHWGENCPARLLGDFAFAIWDEREQRLFAARDPIGMRQFCYAHEPGRCFVFATDPQAVIEHDDVDDSISEPRIANFLDGFEGAVMDRTFYTRVQRLQAAHSLSLARNGGVQISRYWRPEPRPLLRLKSDADYGDALRHHLEQAVRSRLRSATPVGVMMSGGMDSTSVAAVAAQLLADRGQGPLATFSVIGRDDGCVESRAIREAMAIPGIRPQLIDLNGDSPLYETLRKSGSMLADPFDVTMTLHRAVYASARDAGINVVLDGVGGDIALFIQGHIAALMRRGRFVRAWREAVGEFNYWGPHWRPWRPFGRSLAWAFAKSLWPLREWPRNRALDRRALVTGRINLDFALRNNVALLRRNARRRDFKEWRIGRRELAAQLAGSNLIAGRERYDRVAAEFAVEARDPFLDLRLLDFCLSLPLDQFQRDGFPKPILRNAMTGLIPDPVRWRRGKEHLGQRMNDMVVGELWDDELLGELGAFLDPDRLRRGALDRFDVPSQNLRVQLFGLAHWLERHRDRRPTAKNANLCCQRPIPMSIDEPATSGFK